MPWTCCKRGGMMEYWNTGMLGLVQRDLFV